MENLGKKIGKYKVLSIIGEGGMASVFKGQHETLGTQVAIKILNPIYANNPTIRKRFREEAMLLASLNHPNITRVEDYDEEHMAIVMELLHGQNLKEYCEQKKQLSELEIIRFLKQILKAFQFAHENGVIHRDIKPSNIFILPNDRIKILDFGIAKLFGDGKHHTQTGTSLGTPTFMSPEQVKSDKSIDHRSDIYSLGLTVYTMIQGSLPYDNEEFSLYEIFKSILEQQLPKIKSSEFLNTVIHKACEKNRENRYQSCEEWLDEIYEFEKNKDQINEGDSSNSTLQKNSVKSSNFIIFSVILIFTSILGLTLFLVLINRPPEATSNPKVIAKAKIQTGQDKDQHDSIFKTVQIDSQIWMAENLNVDRFINGDRIPEARTQSDWLYYERNKMPAWCYYENDLKNGKLYGRLYNWFAVNDTRGLAPNGWRIPERGDWEVLANREEGDMGKKLKANAIWAITKSDEKGTNEFSFNALPGGYRSNLSTFNDNEYSGYWWCSTETGTQKAWSVYMTTEGNNVTFNTENKNQGCSIRCIKK